MQPSKTKLHPFILALCNEFPEVREEIQSEWPETQVLLHICMGLFETISLEAFRRGDIATVQRYFDFAETGFDDADDALLNAFHVSYAEGFAWGTPYDKTARALMPPRLAEAFDAMVAWPKPVKPRRAA